MGYDENSKTYLLINNFFWNWLLAMMWLLMVSFHMVKTLIFFKKQIIPIEEYEFNFDQDDVFNVVPFSKTTN